MKLTSADHLQDIKGLLELGDSYREIAGKLGCDHGTVAKFVRKYLPELSSTASNGHSTTAARAKLTDPVDEAALIDAELKDLRAAARKNRKLDVQAERLLQELRAITPSAAPTYEAPEQAEGEGHAHAHVLLLSDLHVGEVVDSEAMNGLGEYNFEICKSRMAQIAQSLISFQNARPYPIEELRIWSLGDMVGGKHHQELAETNEFGLIQQAWRTGMLLGKFIETLVEAYPKIHITGIAGNHSRINDKAQAKQVFDSFDWIANKVSELWLRNYTTVTHDYPLAGFAIDKVAGKTVLLGHGDMVRSSMPGIPWGGVARRFNELRKTYAQIGENLDYMAVGHFHQPCVVPGIFLNGSIKGADEYILKAYGSAEPACQLLLTFDKVAERLTDVSYITPA